MREVLVRDLVKNLLGPSELRETLTDRPSIEYVTGILAPVRAEADRDEEPGSEAELSGTAASKEGDADTEPHISLSSTLSSMFDPKRTPSNMGMTFSVSASGPPEIDVCVTWARYLPDADSKWQRTPRCAVFRIGDKNETSQFDSGGNRVDDGGEISAHVRASEDSGIRSISIYVVNRIHVPEGKKVKSDHCVFQPQIRIVCGEGTKLVPGRSTGAASEDEQEDEVLYRNKESLARGHMTSAVWKDVDPELDHPSSGVDFPECVKPGFAWVDGALLPPGDRAKFASCDARTEFVPMHNIGSPDFDWRGENPPQLKPSKYAEEYDKDALRRCLEPFDSQYKRWIDDLRGCRVKHDDVKSRIILAAEDAHKRIKRGIDFICEHDDARLAFCFANRAIAEQAAWAGRKNMEFRPFQLAFILMSAESVLNPRSKDRVTCDLLWVPTGGGKTESYLFLVAMVAAYRRLRASKSCRFQRSGEGVSVISRYTLRLLTIQQFRRTAALFTAMEYLRVHGLGGKGGVGWRPRGRRGDEDFLWGTAPFSVGLWVGNTVTPNSLEDVWLHKARKPGALSILRRSGERGIYGEPAQILECPACGSVLAVPAMGLENPKIHYVIRTEAPKLAAGGSLAEIGASHAKISESKITKNATGGTFTLSIKLISRSRIKDADLDDLWPKVKEHLERDGAPVNLAAASPSRPGYFMRHYTKDGKEKEYDFEVFCPNPACQLVTNWAGGAPLGRIHGRIPDCGDLEDAVCGARGRDDNHMVDVNGAFATERSLADRIPIPALTVDDQLYRILPTMVVSTVDKLARMPFQPKSGSLFGNVDRHHAVKGYYRRAVENPGPVGGREKNNIKLTREIRRPDLIIQDELHLLDGPLGSMAGIYESAVDHLCSNNVKYVASTATAKRSGDHVKALFARELAVFPPKGLDADDRFFVRETPTHPLQDSKAGRLHVGICAPGRGAITPLVRIWARLAQSAGEQRERADIDQFWTVVGYFNTVRELAGARALYRQDIPERMRHLAKLSGSTARTVREEGGQELSGRTLSTDLPSILDLLSQKYPESDDALDGLFTTSMFGTGMDVQRLGAMIVNGQPKTSSSYIQATGRVGRKRGAIVVTLYRASKPRDLNHYEFFVRHHSQLHRFVEPPTVFPFAKRVRERAQGPVMVGMLRNGREASQEWAEDASRMKEHYGVPEVIRAPEILEARSQQQPKSRKPRARDTENEARRALENWRRRAEQDQNLAYVEYAGSDKAVVLGDPKHEYSDASVVYRNAPESLRNIEEETGFET